MIWALFNSWLLGLTRIVLGVGFYGVRPLGGGACLHCGYVSRSRVYGSSSKGLKDLRSALFNLV
jgi:hypothetical protein